MNTVDVRRAVTAQETSGEEWISRWEAAGLSLSTGLEPLSRHFDVSVRFFPGDTGNPGDRLEPENWGTAEGAFTDIGQILGEVMEAEANLDAVLLLTDGNHNYGPDPTAVSARSWSD